MEKDIVRRGGSRAESHKPTTAAGYAGCSHTQTYHEMGPAAFSGHSTPEPSHTHRLVHSTANTRVSSSMSCGPTSQLHQETWFALPAATFLGDVPALPDHVRVNAGVDR